jgi:hypothetical protein
MTTTEKIAWPLAFILLLFAELFIIFLFHRVVVWFKNRRNTQGDHAYTFLDSEEKPPSPFLNYSRALIAISLLLYQNAVSSTLSLLYCVDINGESRLYSDGNVQCYTDLQKGLFPFLAFFLVPFPFLLILLRKLLHHRVDQKEKFLEVNQSLSTQNHLSHAQEMLAVLEASYKPNRSWWETVSILRRFILLCFSTFLRNPVWKAYGLVFSCLLFLYIHIVFKPIRNKTGQSIETLYLTCLTAIAIMSIPDSVYSLSGLSPPSAAISFDKILGLIFVLFPLGLTCFIAVFLKLQSLKKGKMNQEEHQPLLSSSSSKDP